MCESHNKKMKGEKMAFENKERAGLRAEIWASVNAVISADITLEDLNNVIDAVMDTLRPIDAVKDTEPVICYFATEDDREEFIQAIMEVKPNMRTVKV